MKTIAIAFTTELMKLRRSKIVLITTLMFLFIPLLMGLMMFLAKHPDIASRLGVVGTKASMLRFGQADWSAYFGLLLQSITSIGLIGFGFVTSWVFGREYAERTIKDILALPVSRSVIVFSKFIVTVLWCSILAFIFLGASYITGQIIHLSEGSHEIFLQNVCKFTCTTLLTLLLCTPVAFFASYGRGYLLPMGFVIFTLILANFSGLLGLGPYFPWAIPGIYSISSGAEGMHLVFSSYIILLFTSAAGFIATVIWWRIADQH